MVYIYFTCDLITFNSPICLTASILPLFLKVEDMLLLIHSGGLAAAFNDFTSLRIQKTRLFIGCFFPSDLFDESKAICMPGSQYGAVLHVVRTLICSQGKDGTPDQSSAWVGYRERSPNISQPPYATPFGHSLYQHGSLCCNLGLS